MGSLLATAGWSGLNPVGEDGLDIGRCLAILSKLRMSMTIVTLPIAGT